MALNIVILWTEYIIRGDKTYAEVPAKLKDDVKEELIAKGYPELAQ